MFVTAPYITVSYFCCLFHHNYNCHCCFLIIIVTAHVTAGIRYAGHHSPAVPPRGLLRRLGAGVVLLRRHPLSPCRPLLLLDSIFFCVYPCLCHCCCCLSSLLDPAAHALPAAAGASATRVLRRDAPDAAAVGAEWDRQCQLRVFPVSGVLHRRHHWHRRVHALRHEAEAEDRGQRAANCDSRT